MEYGPLLKEDYEEACCPLSKKDEKPTIPLGRIYEKLDEKLSAKDFEGARQHLNYWKAEAEICGDLRGTLAVLNEQIGLYRKTERKEEGLEAISAVLSLADELEMKDTITFGTTLINAATAYKAFDMPEKALPLYEQAEELYEKLLWENDSRRAALCNNMALTVMSLGDISRAQELFQKALRILQSGQEVSADEAITYCNLADLSVKALGQEKAEKQVEAYLDRALDCLRNPALPHDAYYAYVCEKCAEVFGYYGYFMAEEELRQNAKIR